jgi:hypothetical protein
VHWLQGAHGLHGGCRVSASVLSHFVHHFSGISWLLTGLTCHSAPPTRCSHYYWALPGLPPSASYGCGPCLIPRRSIVSLGISRERGGALESFEVERNYNSSILGHTISEHQEMHLQHNLVRDASSSLVSHTTVSSALHSHSARSPAAAPFLVRGNAAPHTAAAVTASSSASQVTDTAVESQKQFSPALSAFVAPSKRLQDSWSELKNEQLQRATRCCRLG